jgi:outer membrane lipoprotein-sorting protein
MTLRTTLAALAFAASCAASGPPQASNPSEALYRKMEAALAAAKNLQVDFESTFDASTVKGSFKIEDGSKLEIKIDGQAGAKKYSIVLKSTGDKMTLTRSETPPPPVPLGDQPELAAPGTLTANVAAGLARGGAWLAQEAADYEYRVLADEFFEKRQATKEGRAPNPRPAAPIVVAEMHTLRNFRPGKAEGGATAVTYDLVRKGESPLLTNVVTVWIDAKGMPVKREGFFATADGKPAGVPSSKWTETYTIK